MDPEKQIIYVLKSQLLPTGNFAEIFVADCSRGLDPDSIRWSRWAIEADIRSIFVDYVNSLIPVLVIQVGGTTNAGLYTLNDISSLQNAPSSSFFSGINTQEKFQIAFGRVPMHPNGAIGQTIQLLVRGVSMGPSGQTTSITPILWPHMSNLFIGGNQFQTVVLAQGFGTGLNGEYNSILPKQTF